MRCSRLFRPRPGPHASELAAGDDGDDIMMIDGDDWRIDDAMIIDDEDEVDGDGEEDDKPRVGRHISGDNEVIIIIIIIK